MYVLGVIPARGGSVGLPRKNLAKVGGIPLVARSIDLARKSVALSRFLVSTDDPEIAAVAAAHGAPVPFMRPAALATNTAKTWEVLSHALRWVEDSEKVRVDAVVTLQPTAPLTIPEDVDRALQRFHELQPQADCLFTACRCDKTHPFTIYFENGPRLRHCVEVSEPHARRQDFPPAWWRNGCVYITRRDLLLNGHRVFSDCPAWIEMPEERSANIDCLQDLAWAEFLANGNPGRAP